MTLALTSLLASLPLVGAAAGGLGWRLSSMLLRPVRVVQYPERVLHAHDGQLCLAPSRWAELPGVWGLRWFEDGPGGRSDRMVIVGPPHPSGAGPAPGAGLAEPGAGPGGGSAGPGAGPAGPGAGPPVCRPVLAGAVPPAGTPVAFDAGLYDDPVALGLGFDTVAVRTPVGDCPAWLVPGVVDGSGAVDGAGPTWVVAVHGRGADRRECLRVLPTLHRLGLSVLAVSYRNDVGAPPSPDGHYHLGDTEWTDLEAAVGYAVAAGARRVVLYGWSMGAAITGAFLDRSPLADRVAAVVWDAPLLDWAATLRQQAALRGLPPWLTRLAVAATRLRIGIDFARFDLVRRPPATRPPTLLFHGTEDTAVPIGPARTLASAVHDSTAVRDSITGWPLRYVEVPGAEHTAAWNVDPAGYEDELVRFLGEHTGSAGGHAGFDLGTAAAGGVAQWHDGRRD